jgi:hypothetical protein
LADITNFIELPLSAAIMAVHPVFLDPELGENQGSKGKKAGTPEEARVQA